LSDGRASDGPSDQNLHVARVSTVRLLEASPPLLHGDGTAFWATGWEALRWLERSVTPEMRTFETGAGASTIVFAASGAGHEAITPSPDEAERIERECRRLGIDPGGVRFHLGASAQLLPALEQAPLDVVLIGGADGFPYPILDWWYLSPRLRVGGHLLVDVAYTPAAGALVDHLRRDRAWQVLDVLGYRTVLARKVDDGPPRALFAGSPEIGRLSFRYLPRGRRAAASIRHRVFTTRPGLACAGLVRRVHGRLIAGRLTRGRT
jgi:precorrin-6B methylase 2